MYFFSLFLLSSIAAEMGDYDDVADRDFLRMHKFLPYQEKVQERIVELHCRHQYVSFSWVLLLHSISPLYTRRWLNLPPGVGSEIFPQRLLKLHRVWPASSCQLLLVFHKPSMTCRNPPIDHIIIVELHYDIIHF